MSALLEQYQESYGSFPKVLVADAGHGSEEHLKKLENHEVTEYVKYSYFDKEQTRVSTRSIHSQQINYSTTKKKIAIIVRWVRK